LLRLVKHPQFQEARVLDQSVDMKNKLASALIHGKTVYQDYKGVEDMYFGYLIDKDGVRNEEKYNVLSTKDLPSAIHLLPNAGIFRGKAVEILEKDPKKLIYKIQGDKNIYGRPTLAPYRDDIGVVIKGHNFSYNDAILVYQDKNGNIDYRKICSDFEDYRRLGPVTSFHLHSIENNGKKIRVNLAYDLVPNIKLDYDINELGLKDLPITEL
jgi:hypothetical protein